MDRDGELLDKITKIPDFFGSVFLRDDLEDWNLAKDLGDFLSRILPDSDVMSHALLTRAYRHLGKLDEAREQLRECHNRISDRDLKLWEQDMFAKFLHEEQHLLSKPSV
ncbi:MAG TPA: hypothetical protein VGL89_00920 [Candidatus Koribacter sp.]|jgi:hypothetical protein